MVVLVNMDIPLDPNHGVIKRLAMSYGRRLNPEIKVNSVVDLTMRIQANRSMMLNFVCSFDSFPRGVT